MNREQYLQEFEACTTKMLEITKAKNHDYTADNDNPFKNFEYVEKFGVATVEAGFFMRMTDKMARIASFIKQGTLEVKDESVEDTLLDLANYAILMRCYLKSKQEPSTWSEGINMDSHE